MKGSCTGELNSVALYLFDEDDENFAIIYIPEKENYKSYYITQDWQNPIEEKHDLSPDTKHYIIDFINKIKSYHLLLSALCLQTGHLAWLLSHGSIHSLWNTCMQGSTRRGFPSLQSPKQMLHSCLCCGFCSFSSLC